jgi:DNA-binding transcriptional LysR family regulator
MFKIDTLLFELYNSVSQTKSLTKTAELYKISQPAVTHNIKKLESIVGQSLIIRTNHGIEFTDSGKEYLIFVRQILSTISNANMRMKNLADGRFSRVRIATVPTTVRYLIHDLDLTRNLSSSYQLQIDAELFEGPDLINTFANDNFYYTTKEQIESVDGFEYIIIGKGSLMLYLNKEHADAIQSDGSSILSNLPLISLPLIDIQLANPIKRLLDINNLPIKSINYYKRTESVLIAVSAGIGVSIMPDTITDYYNYNGINSFELDGGQDCITYVFAWRKTITSKACKLVKDAIFEYYSKNEPSPQLPSV